MWLLNLAEAKLPMRAAGDAMTKRPNQRLFRRGERTYLGRSQAVPYFIRGHGRRAVFFSRIVLRRVRKPAFQGEFHDLAPFSVA
jgi:hypothetical protein